MTQYTSESIRNIALVGHAGAGKTTLAEVLLHHAGAIPTPGSVERGTTVLDFDPQEKEFRHSLDTALCAFESDGIQIHLIDTPGYPDFLGRSVSVLPAVETAALVINAQGGLETGSIRMMESAERRGLCRMIVVNKIDAANGKLEPLMEKLRDRFGPQCLPLNLPAPDGTSVTDCFFAPKEASTAFSSVDAAHTAIVDQVVELDEALMELYLEQGEALSPDQLHDPFEQALREGKLIPVCFTSARTGVGIPELLEVIRRLTPNPLEGNPPPYMKGEGAQAAPVKVQADAQSHALAHVFKVAVDPFVGKLGVFRIHQGTVRTNSQLFIGDGRKPFKVSHLFKLFGKQQKEIREAIPGDICAVAKVDDIHFDSVLHDSHDEDHYHLRSIECPQPMFGLAVEPTRRGDEQKLSEALHKLSAEDPCLVIEHNAVLNETVLRGLGDLHLRVALEKMRSQYNVDVHTRPPRIAYRETITQPAEGHHRHKKQTGGAGQFGEVYLRIEPLARDAGFEFVSAVVGGTIPIQFIPAVEKGVRQVLETGAIAGFPLQDLRVTVHEGKHHPVDSKEIAFVTAGRKAFQDAIRKAGPTVLEPIVNLRINVPEASIGDITSDLSGRRGWVTGTDSGGGGRAEIVAQAPISELSNYASRLKSLTAGEGSYGLEFSHYAAVPPKTQQELASAYKPTEDADS
jgi:elongation factor G